MIQEHYPNRLFVLRKQRNLSQKQVSALIGQKDRTMLSKYERGHVVPSLQIAAKFEALFETSVSNIFPGLFSRSENEVGAEALRSHSTALSSFHN
jgi:transcriptional regulator with XRE-family HTH domain